MAIVEAIRKNEDIKKLEKYFSNTNKRNLLIFSLGINTGLRISDILKLNISDVWNKKSIEMYEIKTKKYKKILLNNKILNLLKEFLKDQQNVKAPLFRSRRGHRLCRTQVYRFLKQACIDCNVDIHVGTHTLRKTFGYHHYKMFNNVALLQKVFNHSTPFITLTYIGITQDEIDFTYKNFEL